MTIFTEDEAISDDAIEECAALLQRWSNDAAEFPSQKDRANLCRNAATAIRNLKSKP